MANNCGTFRLIPHVRPQIGQPAQTDRLAQMAIDDAASRISLRRNFPDCASCSLKMANLVFEANEITPEEGGGGRS